jgi:hypothetical protein
MKSETVDRISFDLTMGALLIAASVAVGYCVAALLLAIR